MGVFAIHIVNHEQRSEVKDANGATRFCSLILKLLSIDAVDRSLSRIQLKSGILFKTKFLILRLQSILSLFHFSTFLHC